MDYSFIFIIKKILQTSVLTVLNKTNHPCSKLYLHLYIRSLLQKDEDAISTLSPYASLYYKGQKH